MDILKAAQCKAIARGLREYAEPIGSMSGLWDIIFDLEAWSKGKPEDVFLKDKSIDWYIDYGNETLMRVGKYYADI